MNEEERRAWDWYYMTLVGWQFHPGNREEELDLEGCADLADEMIRERRYRLSKHTTRPNITNAEERN